MKKIALIILACLLFSSVLAFLANYLIYTPILESNAEQINDQYNEITRLIRFNCALEQALTTKESLLSSQQRQISSLEDEVTAQKAIISALETETGNFQIELEQ